MKRTGKLFNFTYQEKIQNYDDVQMDMLFFIMSSTDIERFTTKESFKEFLIRFFLIRDKDFNEYALEIIDEEIIIDGFLGDSYFSLKIKDLGNLIGFSISDSLYNIKGSIDEFIENYRFEVPSIKFYKISENEVQVNANTMAYILMGLQNLLEIENCNLKFKEHLKEITEREIIGANKLADYVLNRLPEDLFENYKNDFKNVIELPMERYVLADTIDFDVYNNIDKESLCTIYGIIIGQVYEEMYREGGQDAIDCKEDYDHYNESIKFAYGVKHGYIELSTDKYSYFHKISPLFTLDFDCLTGIEGEIYTTQDIYEIYEMDKWIHLVP